MAELIPQHRYVTLSVRDSTHIKALVNSEGKAYAIDWAQWPAAFYVRLPNVRDSPLAFSSHGVDFSTGSLELLKQEDEPGVYYGESYDGAPGYVPLKSRLELCYLTESRRVGWVFTWSCAHMTHFWCIRMLDLDASDGLSPVGNYYAIGVDEGALVARPPYSVSATP